MSKILRRPMFRGGPVDSRGTGITSGLMDGGRVGLQVSFPGTVGQAQKFLTGGDLSELAKTKFSAGMPFPYQTTSLNSNDKTSVVGVEDESQEKVVDDKGSVIEDILKNKALEYGSQDPNKKDVTIDNKIKSYTPSPNEKLTEILSQESTYTDSDGIERSTTSGKIVESESKGRDLEEDAKLSQEAYDANVKKLAEIPNLNLNREEAPEISAKDAVRANQELFADLLGKSKARGQDISDMLLRFSGAEGDTVGEKFKAFTKAEAKAGKSRTEKIDETAGALAIKDFMGGRAAERQAEVMKSKIDYDYGKRGELVNVQPTDDVQTALFKISKKADVPANSDAAIKYLIGIKKDTNRVFRNDKVKIKDLSKPNKIKKLQTGYNIIEEDGVKNIVLYDGSGNVEGIQVFSIGELWKS